METDDVDLEGEIRSLKESPITSNDDVEAVGDI